MQTSAHSNPDRPASSETPARVAVALVGGQSLVRAGVRAVLQQAPDIEIAVEIPRLDVAPATSVRAGCDIALFDDEGSATGIRNVVTSLRALWPGIPVLALVQSTSYALASEWIRAGAQGLISRDDTLDQLPNAVRKVARGELWIDRATSAKLIRELASDQRKPEAYPRIATAGRLSERERQVVALVARGMPNKVIAAELGISENTVRRHLSSIFAKLEVPDRLALALSAHGDPHFARLQ